MTARPSPPQPDAELRAMRFSLGPVTGAKHGMFRTSDRIDSAKERHDQVLVADARTSMCDYRLALATALGRPCDRNGYYTSKPRPTGSKRSGGVRR